MKIAIPDQMPRKRAEAEAAINRHFDNMAMPHRDAEYAAKRQAAARHLAGIWSEHIEREAALRGTSADELAAQVDAMAVHVLDRGLQRVELILAVRAAATPEQITTILARLAAPPADR